MTKEGSAHSEELPYRIVLWAAEAEERILARAVTAQLALAIFKAAQQEHPGHRVAIKKDEAIVADSSQPT
jgi:hypothetical protein